MNSRKNVLDALSLKGVANPDMVKPEKRQVISKVAAAALSSKKPRAKDVARDGHAHYTLRNLPDASRAQFKALKEQGHYRESFNSFVLDAIDAHLAKLQRKANREAK